MPLLISISNFNPSPHEGEPTIAEYTFSPDKEPILSKLDEVINHLRSTLKEFMKVRV